MAVIIRETRVVGGKTVENMPVYKTSKFLTSTMRRNAEELDKFLGNKIKEIRPELKKIENDKTDTKKLNTLRSRFELGKRLNFVDDPKIVSPEDKHFIWRALFDHAPDFAPGPPDERADKRPETSFFSYCYELGKLSWELVQSGGEWSSWQRIFDLAIRKDRRVLEWMGQERKRLQTVFKKDWLKETTKMLTKQFHNRDTSVLNEIELKEELNEAVTKAMETNE